MFSTKPKDLFTFWHVVICLLALSLLHRRVRQKVRNFFGLLRLLIQRWLRHIFTHERVGAQPTKYVKWTKPKARQNEKIISSINALKSSTIHYSSVSEQDGRKLSQPKPVNKTFSSASALL